MFQSTESFQLSDANDSPHQGPSFRSHFRNGLNATRPTKSTHVFSRYNLVEGSEDDLGHQAFAESRQSHSSRRLSASTSLNPGRTGKFGTDLVIEILLCASAVLAAIPFIWLAVVIARYNGQRVNERDSEFIRQSTSTVSTLFTILFAAVIGTTLKRYATWQLEKGVSIGFLEQIMQSRTFFSAVTTQLALRAVNATAVILLCAWTFSPLGSQACLRLISTRVEYSSSSSLVSHLDTVSDQVFAGSSSVSSLLTSLKPTYVSTILSPGAIKNSSMDLWGNVRIPWLREDLEKDEAGWADLTKSRNSEKSYSSLIGIPVSNLANANSTFAIETTHITLDCATPEDVALIDIATNITLLRNGTFFGPNTTLVDDSDGIYPFWQVAMDQFVSTDYVYGYPQQLENFTSNDISAPTLLFQTRNAVSRCKIRQAYVESNVSCSAQSTVSTPACAVQAQRRSLKKHAPATITTFSFPTTFAFMSQQWIRATDKLSSSGYSSLAEYYLQNTSTQFILAGNDREYANYGGVTAEQFSTRLGQLLNTWILAGQVSADTMDYSMSHLNATALYSEGVLTYVCSWTWLAVYCASIAVMFAAALITIWCALHTTVPDVLGYCSSLTRDSKHFEQMAGRGSTMDGLQRAKAMQHVKVRLGEVDGPSDVKETRFQQPGGFRNEIPSQQLGMLAIGPSNQVHMAKRGKVYA